MITIIKTKEQAEAERAKHDKQITDLISERECPFCKTDSHTEYDHEYASERNLLISLFSTFGLMNDKLRYRYHCKECGAEWIGEWYEE